MAIENSYGFAFCESAQASSFSPWHIRKLTAVGKKLGGGANTPALCGRVVAWDLESEVRIPSAGSQTRVCSSCAEEWDKRAESEG